MKKIIVSLLAAMISLIVDCAQEKAPTAVQNACKAEYPDAKSVKWGMENAKEWEAEFKKNWAEM